METDLEPATTITTTTASVNDVVSDSDDDDDDYIDDSNCSTPYVSAPSSPGNRTTTGFLSHPPPPGFFFYSAPTSPMHYVLSSSAAARSSLAPAASDASSSGSFEFEFSSRFESPAAPEIGGGGVGGGGAMSSADELFLNGQIRPMKLCAHLSRPQHLPPFSSENGDIIEEDEEEEEEDDVVFNRSRDVRLRDRSQRRRTRSMSPLRSTVPFDWFLPSDDTAAVSTPKKAVAGEGEVSETDGEKTEAKEFPSAVSGGSASSSRCSSAGRSSKRWVFLKDFLRSKSEGRSNNKFWQNMNISFSPAKEKEKKQSGGNTAAAAAAILSDNQKAKRNSSSSAKEAPAKKSSSTAAAKRRSAHEMHYAANRAQAEEMRKKTFLPYRQGLLGCLGFNSKSYGALNGFARALNPVSSR